jgi:hypothetical protein
VKSFYLKSSAAMLNPRSRGLEICQDLADIDRARWSLAALRHWAAAGLAFSKLPMAAFMLELRSELEPKAECCGRLGVRSSA